MCVGWWSISAHAHPVSEHCWFVKRCRTALLTCRTNPVTGCIHCEDRLTTFFWQGKASSFPPSCSYSIKGSMVDKVKDKYFPLRPRLRRCFQVSVEQGSEGREVIAAPQYFYWKVKWMWWGWPVWIGQLSKLEGVGGGACQGWKNVLIKEPAHSWKDVCEIPWNQ